MEKELNQVEKLILLNQYKILRDLAVLKKDENDEELYDNNIKILQNGFAHNYTDLTDELSNDMLNEDCELVWDILELYSYINFSFKRLKNSTIKETDIKFIGFDGNNELELRSYCKFIIKDLHRFCELLDSSNDDLNSHHEMFMNYKKMIEKWNDMGKPYELSEEQIIEILGL